jgi:multidrug efflux pump subunit AcrA (membrane-fusion protein)
VGNPCLEITNTEELLASGEVDEIESAEVRPAQRVRLRLDALPETEWTGRVTALRPNVYRQGPRNPLKVIGVEIALDHRDPGRLRPGMQFRGRLETDRKSGVLLVPVDAVFPGPEGPVAFRRTTTGHERVALRLGRRSRSQVEILAGLAEGDRVARRDLAAGEGR